MDRDKNETPPDQETGEQAGAESRREMDKVPEPGTDPLHEGP